MAKRISHSESEVNARDLRDRFSAPVQDAFRAIAVLARESEHFDAGIYQIVKNWSSDKATTVHDFMIAFPSVTREVMEHTSATNDQAMKQAWDDLCTQLPQNGFIVSQPRQLKR